MRDFVSITAAQNVWAAQGLYPRDRIDGRWGSASAGADERLPWLRAAQTYWRELGWYPERKDDGKPLKIDGTWGTYSERAHAKHAVALSSLLEESPNARRWSGVKVADPARFEWAIAQIKQHRGRYIALGASISVPWWFIACLHCRESSFSFKKHLHNGDPLTARTVRVPAGRPKNGHAPFSWEESARDAIGIKGWIGLSDWSIPAALERLERFNGLGYRNRGLPSPYLWAGTNRYALTAKDGLPRGKYLADGVFSATTIDRQCGCAGIIKLLGVS